MNSMRKVNAQRVVGCLLVLLQAVALGVFFRTYVFTPIAIAAVLFGLFSQAWLLPSWIAKRLPILLPLLYAIHRTVLPDAWSGGLSSFLIPGASLIAQYFVVYQVAMFFVASDEDRLPSHLPILAITAMVFTGDVRPGDGGRLLFQVFSLTLVLLSIAFHMTSVPPGVGFKLQRTAGHTRWLIGVVVLCSLTAWASASGLHRYSREIESSFNRFVHPSMRQEAVGFSGGGRIGSVATQKDTAGDRVAIRVFATHRPGYLRGKVFETYTIGQWQRYGTTRSVPPSKVGEPVFVPPKYSLDQFFHLDASYRPGESRTLEIWPAQPLRDVLLTPLDLIAVQAPVERLSVDLHDAVSADLMPAETRYVVWQEPADDGSGSSVGQQRRGLTEQEYVLLTALPDRLDPQINEIADQVVGDSVTTAEKIAAVEFFFHEYFEYRFGIDVPADRDPVEYFLLQRTPAHCEYFASGAAILLRSAGVPCRYATGFVAAEKNEVGGYWVARNRDAHAWVEAYDPERGWVIVEATPASGVPDSTPRSSASQSWDAMLSRWQRMMATIRSTSLTRVFTWLGSVLVNRNFVVLISLAALALLFRRLRKRTHTQPDLDVDPGVRRMQQMLREMDDRWRALGIPRLPHETLHQFAERLELTQSQATDDTRSRHSTKEPVDHAEAANWYRRFAELRYSGGSLE